MKILRLRGSAPKMKCFDAEAQRHREKIKTGKVKAVINISSSPLRRQEPSDFEVSSTTSATGFLPTQE
ncbi:hypothetical protein MNBD_GAMMA08-3123 [hydrothermal vent metagenome]|uniref:Uncharacterized protein n=1 Tax=hydrothermal vent metagenome TaxID=652676 RepID=A0A3B0XRA3_9ZZZZ